MRLKSDWTNHRTRGRLIGCEHHRLLLFSGARWVSDPSFGVALGWRCRLGCIDDECCAPRPLGLETPGTAGVARGASGGSNSISDRPVHCRPTREGGSQPVSGGRPGHASASPPSGSHRTAAESLRRGSFSGRQNVRGLGPGRIEFASLPASRRTLGTTLAGCGSLCRLRWFRKGQAPVCLGVPRLGGRRP